MVIVAGHLIVDPRRRDEYLAGCAEVVAKARAAAGCLDLSIGADLVDEGRINVFERWESQAAVAPFRGDGPDDEQTAMIKAASVAEYEVSGSRSLS